MEENQKKIKFGNLREEKDILHEVFLDEFEVDETSLRAQAISNNHVQFKEIVGLKRRGDPHSLFVEPRSKVHSISARTVETGRAAPPPLTAEEWDAIRDARVGGDSLCHSDGARCYDRVASGAAHDYVVHGNKKKEFTKPTCHITKDGEPFYSVGGTQSLDGWWSTATRNTSGVGAKHDRILLQRVREKQWHHWIGDKDRWLEAGHVITTVR